MPTKLSIINGIENLNYLDISNNNILISDTNLSNLIYLKVFKFSTTNSLTALNLNFSFFEELEEIDLSNNDLSTASNNYFVDVAQLKKVNLRNAHLKSLEIIKDLVYLEELDLSDNDLNGQIIEYFIGDKIQPKNLKMSNVSLKYFRNMNILKSLKFLDINRNFISDINYSILEGFVKLEYLDLSFNKIESLEDENSREDENVLYFLKCKELKYLNLRKTFEQKLSNLILNFYFKVDTAILSENNFDNFPLFCQTDAANYDSCYVRVIHLDFNKIKEILKDDLVLLENLEYLNLENNLIENIEDNSFESLTVLETLILSFNRLQNLPSGIFNNLVNLKLIDLKSNNLSFIESFTFNNLNKLESIDLSNNSIYRIKEYSFNLLVNLKDLFLENEINMAIELNSFNRFDSIQNIYVSRRILDNNSTQSIFIELIGNKNILNHKKILKREYFKSVNLITLHYFNFTQLDCELVLKFIRFNIHLNLKTENDYDNFLSSCLNLTL